MLILIEMIVIYKLLIISGTSVDARIGMSVRYDAVQKPVPTVIIKKKATCMAMQFRAQKRMSNGMKMNMDLKIPSLLTIGGSENWAIVAPIGVPTVKTL